MQRKYYIISVLLLFLILASSCQKEDTTTILKNDCIKRTLGPNVVGSRIEFAYAMALPQTAGKITSASVDASIAGGTGTFLENRSFYTNSSGVDVGITVGSPSVTTGAKTEVTFTKDTCAATLRYTYVIPEEARGNSVSFTFSVQASNGEKVTFAMGPYTVAKMDMKLDMVVTDAANRYISIANLTVYDSTNAAANAANIDLVYLYRVVTGVTFLHALVSPATDVEYRPGINLPAGVTNTTKFIKMWALRDQQLARLQYGVFIDDIDFQKLDFTGMPNFGINLKAEAGAWVETADGKYRAYIYVNAINSTAKTMTISIKRFTMK
jgi:hypothetical protein